MALNQFVRSWLIVINHKTFKGPSSTTISHIITTFGEGQLHNFFGVHRWLPGLFCHKPVKWCLLQTHCLKIFMKVMLFTYSIRLYPECKVVEALEDRQPGSNSHVDWLVSLFTTWFYLNLLDSTWFYLNLLDSTWINLILLYLYFICSVFWDLVVPSTLSPSR